MDSLDLFPQHWSRLFQNPGPLFKKSKPEISIVIPCYKQAKYLPSVLSSVIAQRFPEWEVIIVDDGSPDETTLVSKKLIESYPDRRIKLVRKSNGGLADARNAGIAEAQGKYILPLDADDLIHPDMLAKTKFLLDTSNTISIAYTDVQKFGSENCIVTASEYDFKRLIFQNQLNCCSLFRKEAWDSVWQARLFW
jgi:glycosyltransferase involved in cell wall biosynthesis